jgi:hypothetical protein
LITIQIIIGLEGVLFFSKSGKIDAGYFFKTAGKNINMNSRKPILTNIFLIGNKKGLKVQTQT